MTPVRVATLPALGWGRGLGGIACQPLADIVVEILLAPDHTGQGLSLYGLNVRVGQRLLQAGVEFVRLLAPPVEDVIEISVGRSPQSGCQSQTYPHLTSGRHGELVVGGAFRSRSGWIDRFCIPLDQKFVKGILEIAFSILHPEEASRICLILAKQAGRSAFRVQRVIAEHRMF